MKFEVLEYLKKLSLTGRNSSVNIQYQQPYSNILKEGIVERDWDSLF